MPNEKIEKAEVITNKLREICLMELMTVRTVYLGPRKPHVGMALDRLVSGRGGG